MESTCRHTLVSGLCLDCVEEAVLCVECIWVHSVINVHLEGLLTTFQQRVEEQKLE